MYVTTARFQLVTKQKKNYHKSNTNKKEAKAAALEWLKNN